jgi:short subunit dehydrogenase-like uncharacterized protein
MLAGRVVVFGATGYTGELTARAMVARGMRPVLAARRAAPLQALAEELGGPAGALEHAVVDATSPVSLAALVEPGDVLVSTVGPFARWGGAAVDAALAGGAHYLDSTGEPSFIARVFRTWGPQADSVGCALLPAMGYDFVPGNLAGALALADAVRAGDVRAGDDRAGDDRHDVTRVDVGYFVTGGSVASAVSGGTRASLAGAALEPGLVLRDGRLVTEPGGRRVRGFVLRGRTWQGVSIGASEHFTLPALHSTLTDVGVYLGWAGRAARAVQLLSYPASVALALPGVRAGIGALLGQVVRGSTGGPDAEDRARTGTLVVAEAVDRSGQVRGRAVLAGGNPYEFTAAFLAWAAARAASGQLRDVGALGPVEAFGLEALEAGVAEAGVRRCHDAG